MNGTILKYFLLIFVILINVFAFYTNVPFESLIELHLILAIAPLLIVLVLKNDMVNLLALWFILALFKKTLISIKLPMLPGIFPERVVLILIFCIFMFELIMKKRRIRAFSGVEIAMILFSVYIIFSMIFSGTIFSKEKGITLGAFLAAYGIPFFIFFISKNIIDNEDKIKKIFIFLSFVGLYLGLTAIFEYFGLKKLIFPKAITVAHWGGLYGRARGPFLDPAPNGTVIGMLIFTIFPLLLAESRKWRRWFYAVTLLCLSAALVFTLTRSAWLGFFVAILTVPIFIPRLRGVFFISLLVLPVVSLLMVNFANIKTKTFASESELMQSTDATLLDKIVHRTTAEGSVIGRLDLYKIAFVKFLDSPFFGLGYGKFGKSEESGLDIRMITGDTDTRGARIHDSLISLLIDAGLAGLSLYLFIIFYIFNICRKLYFKLPRDGFLGKDLIVMCTGALIVFFVSTQMYDVRYFFFPTSLLFCIAGIMAGLYHKISQSENRSSGRLTV